MAYVRTYEVELELTPSGDSALEAIVRHVRAFDRVRLELDLVDGGRTMEPRSQDRFEALGSPSGSECMFRRRTCACFPDGGVLTLPNS